MALTVRRTQYVQPRRSGLTPLGIAAIAVAVLLIIVLISIPIAGQAKKNADRKAAEPIYNAIQYAMTVSRQTAAALGGASDTRLVEDVAAQLEKEEDPLKQADAAQTLLGEMLRLAQGSQSSIDEINGAKNRIQLAVRDYSNRS